VNRVENGFFGNTAFIPEAVCLTKQGHVPTRCHETSHSLWAASRRGGQKPLNEDEPFLPKPDKTVVQQQFPDHWQETTATEHTIAN